jgi:hypothetical protein
MRLLGIGLASIVALFTSILTARGSVPTGGALGGELCLREERAAHLRQPSDSTLFLAVLEGLYLDGVPNDVVDAVLETDAESGFPRLFVQGCPICMPAHSAFRVYRARTPLHYKDGSDTFGRDFPEELRRTLTSGALADRHAAIQALIERWVDVRMRALQLDEDERKEWREDLEQRRKKGMSMLDDLRQRFPKSAYAGQKACAFCDGAAGACERR